MMHRHRRYGVMLRIMILCPLGAMMLYLRFNLVMQTLFDEWQILFKKHLRYNRQNCFLCFGSSSLTRTTSVCNISSTVPTSGLFHCVAAPSPRSLHRPLDAVAARSPASASGSQARWFVLSKKRKQKKCNECTFFVLAPPA